MGDLKLEQVPGILQKAVQKYQEERPHAKLLGVMSREITPYKDKSIKSIIYVAHIENSSLMVTLKYAECSVQDWSDHEVRESWLNVADINFFIENSSWFKEKFWK